MSEPARETTPANVPAPSPPSPASSRRAKIRRVVTWLVALAALAFVAWMVPLRDRCTDAGCTPGLITTIKGANVFILVAMFGLYVFGTLIWAARWRALLGLAEVRLSIAEVWRVTLEAQAGGILLPGGVAGDALRVAHVKAKSPEADLAKIVASIFADRVVGLVTLATIATTAAFASGGSQLGASLHVLAAIPVAAVLGWIVVSRPSLARASIFSRGLAARVVRPMLEYTASRGGPRALGQGFVLSLLVSGSQLLVIRGLVAALGVHPDREAWVYVGATFGMIVAALPLLPGSWGTADAAYVFFLGQAGIPAPAAAAVCLLYRVFWYATGTMGAASALFRRPQ